MSIETSVSMRELELEGAELLPNRETLYVAKCSPWGGGPTQAAGAIGLVNIFSGDNINVFVI